jgi:hypothetical protein
MLAIYVFQHSTLLLARSLIQLEPVWDDFKQIRLATTHFSTISSSQAHRKCRRRPGPSVALAEDLGSKTAILLEPDQAGSREEVLLICSGSLTAVSMMFLSLTTSMAV